MNTAEVQSACIACPTNAALSLSELSRQYVEPQEWLFSHPDDRRLIGYFSLDAVRAAVMHHRISGDPRLPSYGEPIPVMQSDLTELVVMQRAIRDGNHLRPQDISKLKAIADKRMVVREDFASLPSIRQRQRADAARPFLEKVAASLLETHPEIAELDGTLEFFADQDESENFLTTTHGSLRTRHSIDRLHGLDQGAFLIAREALQGCGGPWAYTRHYPLLGTHTRQVCPNGSARNQTYYKARLAAERQTEG